MDFSSMFDSVDFSDITFTCGDRAIKCHRLILSQGSEYFKKLCNPWSAFAESEKSTIELKDDDPLVVEVMLRFIYKGKIEAPKHSETRSRLLFNLRLMAAGDKYLMPRLHNMALGEVHQILEQISGNVDDMVQALRIMPDFYDSEPTLKAVAGKLRFDNIASLMQDDNFREVLSDDPEAMLKLITTLITKLPKRKEEEEFKLQEKGVWMCKNKACERTWIGPALPAKQMRCKSCGSSECDKKPAWFPKKRKRGDE